MLAADANLFLSLEAPGHFHMLFKSSSWVEEVSYQTDFDEKNVARDILTSDQPVRVENPPDSLCTLHRTRHWIWLDLAGFWRKIDACG